MSPIDGRAVVYCERAFGTLNGKTAHGLVRRTRRYDVRAVIDSGAAGRDAGRDAGEALDGRPVGIPLCRDLESAMAAARAGGGEATHFVIGLAPDGGRLAPQHRESVTAALQAGLHVDSGLHDFLSEDPEFARLAAERGLRIRDVRKPPPRSALHFFTGKIEQVDALTIAVLGTDSAVGKRTTAWLLVDALNAAGHAAELVGTGQTAWMQGARWGIVLDSLVNDFLAGEIEHAVWSCWNEARPRVIVLEGQGSLMNPAYPGGHELIAAGRPDAIVLQHAPARREYDGFPGYAIHPLEHQIRALELVSGKPVVALGINHEGLSQAEIEGTCAALRRETGRPAVDPLLHGAEPLARAVVALSRARI